MGRAIRTHEAGAIHGEANRQVLQSHIMHDLVIAALQEGRIDRAERLVAFRCKACGKGHRMLLGDAHIEGASGISLAEEIEPCARRHGGGDRHDLVVMPGLFDEAVGEDLRVGGRIGLGLGLRAGHHVEGVHAMVFVG